MSLSTCICCVEGAGAGDTGWLRARLEFLKQLIRAFPMEILSVEVNFPTVVTGTK